MEKLLNFRKLAEGMTNVEGKKLKNIYRSADSSTAAKEDIEYLVENNILDIIDLRSEYEISKLMTISDERINRVHINILNHAKQNELAKFSFDKMKTMMMSLYEEEFAETDGFANEMAYILELEGRPFLFHCTAGKDRTGITGAVLMYILGFTKEQIVEEYLKIDDAIVETIRQANFKIFADNNVELNDEVRQVVNDTSCIKVEFIDAYFNSVCDVYGTFDNYVENKLKLSKFKIEKLKEYYLS